MWLQGRGFCRHDVMLDLLLGGPGETCQTVAESIDFVKQIGPDCAGAALGIRIYPGTAMAQIVRLAVRHAEIGQVVGKMSADDRVPWVARPVYVMNAREHADYPR